MAQKELPEKQLEASGTGRALSVLAILGHTPGFPLGESRQGHGFCRPVDSVGPDIILRITNPECWRINGRSKQAVQTAQCLLLSL